ncbi:hypothetical protein MMEU_1037 [Mycobacterium marinum str. Europe]|nr:hypothetical protein MMEU_1037 [Mycobacterium marinum str. Europe]
MFVAFAGAAALPSRRGPAGSRHFADSSMVVSPIWPAAFSEPMPVPVTVGHRL